MSIIENEWDMSDVDQATDAQALNNFVLLNQLDKVLEFWNTCNINCDSEHVQFYYVNEHQISTVGCVPTAWAPDFFVALCDEEEVEEVEEEEDEDDSPFQATTPGATCRGSHAEYNPDAYADKRDGTYLCYQCKMFKHVFG
jgi:hypothetical protein